MKRKLIFRSIAILGPLLFGGCAAMNVQVEVLSKKYIDTTPSWLADDLKPKVLSARAELLEDDGHRSGFERAAQDAFSKVEQNLKDLAKQLGMSPAEETTFIFSVQSEIQNSFKDAKAQYISGVDAYDKASALPSSDSDVQRLDLLHNAEACFADGDSILNDDLPKRLHSILNGPVAQQLNAQQEATHDAATAPSATASSSDAGTKIGAATPKSAPITAASAAAQAAVATDYAAPVTDAAASIIGNNGLLSDAHTADVVSAPDPAWQGVFNKAFGGGSFGNTDIAVKMESLGDFTLKGVRVDATKVTTATFSAIGEAVKLAAAAYGIPVGTGATGGTSSSGGTTTGGSGSGNTSATDPITQADQNGAAARAQSELIRSAAISLLTTAAAQAAALEKDGKPNAAAAASAAPAAITNFQNAFAAYGSMLTGTAPTAQTQTNNGGH